ncbi:MAG: hypothetical protein AAGJ83_01915 [Planctomycetota bacterium]
MISLTTKAVVRVDSAEVSAAVGAANARALTRGGGRIRKTARNSIPFRKRRTTVSKPGSPPNAHSRGKGIKTILYGYDRRTHSLVVGFAKLGNVSGKDVAKRLEEGGTARIRVHSGGGKKAKTRKRGSKRERSAAEKNRIREHYQRKKASSRTMSVKVRKRPTMVPALKKNLSELPSLWRGEVKPATSLY